MIQVVPLTKELSLKRTLDQGTSEQLQTVSEILEDVKRRGEEALFEYTEKFDHVKTDNLWVTAEELETAHESTSSEALTIIREAITNIRDFHQRQIEQSWFTTKEDGTILGQKVTPLDSVGVYVPGGRAAYPSSIIMNVVPAQAAGVKRIIMASPPNKDGALDQIVLATAHELGVTQIMKAGGAQAVAALAFGTASLRSVDKIVGPGNIYVALAKKLVFGQVDIDMIAGPSEIAVLADEDANPAFIAADMLSQAEHDPMSSAVLVTTSLKLAEQTAEEVEKQLSSLPKEEIARQAIEDYGMIYVAESLDEAIEAINELAAEHLELQVKDPWQVMAKIRHAGAIFLGENSSEPIGDYFAGPNHVLPTNGTARFSSPLSVDDFVKKSSVIYYSKEAVRKNGKKIAAFARLENLEAHARAVEKRLEDK